MHIDQLKAFLEITRCGNFKDAATALYVTQSTITMRIKTMESQLGQQLFVRNKKGAELTVAGRQFLPYAEQIVLTWRQANQELSLPSNLQSVIQLGVEAALYDSFLKFGMMPLKRALPHLGWQLHVARTDTLLHALQDGRLHWVVGLEQRGRSDTLSTTIGHQELILVATEPRAMMRWDAQFVHIEWGGEFRTRYAEVYPYDQTPSVTLPPKSDLVDFLLQHGGSAYLPRSWVKAPLASGQLHYVKGAPQFDRSVHLYCQQPQADKDTFSKALEVFSVWGKEMA